jgi:hypothetical protein
MPASPGPSWRERHVSPRHAPVWVRVHGAWRKGTITEWVTDRGGGRGWECAIAADGPQDLPWQGRYVYDPLAIRPRHGDIPPALCSAGLCGAHEPLRASADCRA